MKLKSKLFIKYPLIAFRNRRARVVDRKIRKANDEQRYPEPWKTRYVMKKNNKFIKNLGIQLKVKGYENLPKPPFLLVANHASIADPVLIIKALENPEPGEDKTLYEPTFLAKEELSKNKVFKGYLGILSTVYVARDNPRSALKQIETFGNFVKDKAKVGVVFPEGTRSKDGNIQDFKTGGFWIAKKKFLNIVPVTLNNSSAAANLDRTRRATVEVVFGSVIKAGSFLTIDTKTLTKKVQAAVAQNFQKPKISKSNLENIVS